MSKQYWVYIIGNQRPILYVGVTSDLVARIHQHKTGTLDGFSKKYKLKSLLYFETHNNIQQAITREKQIKRWRREWKLSLIRKSNPSFKDLYTTLF